MINSPYSQLPFQSDWCQINPWQWAMTTRWSLILSQKGRSAIVSCLIQLKLAGLVIVWPSFPGCFLWGTVKKITKCLSIWKNSFLVRRSPSILWLELGQLCTVLEFWLIPYQFRIWGERRQSPWNWCPASSRCILHLYIHRKEPKEINSCKYCFPKSHGSKVHGVRARSPGYLCSISCFRAFVRHVLDKMRLFHVFRIF